MSLPIVNKQELEEWLNKAPPGLKLGHVAIEPVHKSTYVLGSQLPVIQSNGFNVVISGCMDSSDASEERR